jgi:hypothetical protein
MEPTQNPAVAVKPRHTMLPLLAALFLISYALLTTLVVLQDRTIDSQRNLIHSLFSDNLHLVATRVGLHSNQATHSNQNPAQGSVPKRASSSQVSSTQIPSAQTPSTQTPSTQAPSTQANRAPSNQVSAVDTPSTQVPVIQAKPDSSTKSDRKSRKAQKAAPMRPPVEVTDPSDMRRVSISI